MIRQHPKQLAHHTSSSIFFVFEIRILKLPIVNSHRLSALNSLLLFLQTPQRQNHSSLPSSHSHPPHYSLPRGTSPSHHADPLPRRRPLRTVAVGGLLLRPSPSPSVLTFPFPHRPESASRSSPSQPVITLPRRFPPRPERRRE